MGATVTCTTCGCGDVAQKNNLHSGGHKTGRNGRNRIEESPQHANTERPQLMQDTSSVSTDYNPEMSKGLPLDMSPETIQLLMNIDDASFIDSPKKNIPQTMITKYPSNTSQTSNITTQSNISTLTTNTNISAMTTTTNVSQLPIISITNENGQEKIDLILQEEVSTEKIVNKPAPKRVTSDDKKITPTNERMMRLSKITDLKELENEISRNYETDPETEDDNNMTHDDTEDSSDLDEEEKEEIKRRKTDQETSSEKITKMPAMGAKNAKVYRMGTSTEWGNDDVDNLHREMSRQLLDLAKQASDVNPQLIHEINQTQPLSQPLQYVPSKLSDLTKGMDDGHSNKDSLSVDDLPTSKMFREGSADNWKKQQIDVEKADMRKQLIHLAHQQQQSINMDMDMDNMDMNINTIDEDPMREDAVTIYQTDSN